MGESGVALGALSSRRFLPFSGKGAWDCDTNSEIPVDKEVRPFPWSMSWKCGRFALQAEVFEEIATMDHPFEGIPTVPPRKDVDHLVLPSSIAHVLADALAARRHSSALDADTVSQPSQTGVWKRERVSSAYILSLLPIATFNVPTLYASPPIKYNARRQAIESKSNSPDLPSLPSLLFFSCSARC
eukprot:scaffold37735_cov17-Tisochrysis_lutea.AAC.1